MIDCGSAAHTTLGEGVVQIMVLQEDCLSEEGWSKVVVLLFFLLEKVSLEVKFVAQVEESLPC